MKLTTVAFAVVAVALSGCETITPDTLSIDAGHTSHHYGSGPYDYGADTIGVGEHWKRGRVTLDLAEYGRQDKPYGHVGSDQWEPEFTAQAHYTIPLK